MQDAPPIWEYDRFIAEEAACGDEVAESLEEALEADRAYWELVEEIRNDELTLGEVL